MDKSCKDKYKYWNLRAQDERKIHYFLQPHGVGARMMAELGHQMKYTIEQLEKDLAKEGIYHYLQLDISGSNAEPSSWTLYVNGKRAASGEGKYARELFYKDAYAFYNLCKEAIEYAEIPSYSESEYKLLYSALEIRSKSGLVEFFKNKLS